MKKSSSIFLISGFCVLLSGCSSTLDKLDTIGKPPKLAEVDNPTEKAQYQPMTWPLPENQPPPKQYANSLWQPGARAFFRDQRASRVGDILRVNVKIDDKAQLVYETENKRTSTDDLSAPTLFGIEKMLPKKMTASSLVNISGTNDSKGTGTVKRTETITTQVAALITQVLPNGNYVIDGKQEILVNYEVREVSVKGVIRPADLKSDNTIDSTQIAEARITYGGHGQLSDVQQPRWGHQVLEQLSPF